MREVAKSILGLSWAVSLFGFQQLSKAMTPSPAQPADLTASEVEEVSRMVQSRLSDSTSEQFRAGDQWQRRMVDVLFDAASMQSLDPRRMVEAFDPRTLIETADPRAAMEASMTWVQKGLDTAADAMRQTADGAVNVAKRAVATVTPPATA